MKSTTTRIKDIFKMKCENKEITVQGWLRTKRESSNLCFLELNDGSVMKNLQIIMDAHVHVTDYKVTDYEIADYKSLISCLTTGCSLKITGKLVPSPGKNQTVELKAKTINIIGDAPASDFPLQKKHHSFEFLRTITHLRPRTNTFGAIARVRNAVSFAVHRFFQEKGFLYIHTPIITTSDCEGAGEMFQVTTPSKGTLSKNELKNDLENELKESDDYSQDFFE